VARRGLSHTSPTPLIQFPLAPPGASADTQGVTRRPRLPFAIRWPMVLLCASLGLVLFTTWVALAAARKHRDSTAQLLRDYAAFAAWSYAGHLTSEMEESIWYTVSPIEHREPHQHRMIPHASDLIDYRANNLRLCNCDPPARPASYFSFLLGSDSLEIAGRPLTPGLQSSIPRVMTQAIRGPLPTRRSGVIGLDRTGNLAAYGLMPTSWGDTIVYGFTFDSAALVVAFDSVLTHASLLPAAVTHGRENAELLTLEVRDTTGHLLYQAADWPADPREWPYIAEESLPPLKGGLVARLTVRPEAAGLLLSGGLPRTPLPLLLLVGVLGVALSVMAVSQLRREGELVRLRSDFVAAVSHELRTPLAQIRLFLDTLRLRRYDTEAEQEWLVGHLVRETTRLEHLVENVLAASRLERGAPSQVPLETLDLGQEVTEAVAAFAPLAASRQAALQTELATGIEVRGDRAALRQLLLNLLDNAVKFGPRGQTVRIGVSRDSEHGRLIVSDQGPGVSSEERERIWEPYYRGSSQAARAVGGSGIGLAIVREIADRFGGVVTVGEAADSGAEFCVEFPLIQTPVTTA
jgi:signal transduction histidine kinase